MWHTTDIHARSYSGEFSIEWYVEDDNGPPYVVFRLQGDKGRVTYYFDLPQLAQFAEAGRAARDALAQALEGSVAQTT